MKSFYPLLSIPTPSSADTTKLSPIDRFSTSWLLPPLQLALLRLLLSLYAFTTLIFIFAYDGAHHTDTLSRRSFSYFTYLSYWGLAFYFLVSGIHSLTYATNKSKDTETVDGIKKTSLLARLPRYLQALHSIFYTTIITFPLLVTIVFWAILYSPPFFPQRFAAWSNISQHALNTVFAVLEIVLPATLPPPLLHLPILILLLLLYLALAYITYASQGFYPYDFLDTHKGSGKVTAYAFGILAAISVIFGVVWGLIWLRVRFTEGRKRRRGEGGGSGEGGGQIEMKPGRTGTL